MEGGVAKNLIRVWAPTRSCLNSAGLKMLVD
jgi:hypothetical protein